MFYGNETFSRWVVLCSHFYHTDILLQMMMVLYVFSLTFTFSNTFGIKWWSIFKQAKNQHSKAGEGLLSSSHQVRCGSKHGVSNPRGSQPSAPWAALWHFEWEMARNHAEESGQMR